MQILRIFKLTAPLVILVLLSSCATPTSPSGGPPDKQGPEIVSTRPETGTTNFEGRSIELGFSEFVDRNSLENAIVIEPDIGLKYSLDWGRKSVEIEFEEKLPKLTTVIVTIGTELKDTNGNKLAAPKKIAVSTGPEIDKGELNGRIVDAETGKGEDGNRVLLYRSPVDLTTKADYIAETDTSGRFRFSYLRQGDYKAFWVDDRNRNKIWDRGREFAQPFYRETISLEKAGSDTLSPLYLAPTDTAGPALQGLGLFSTRRMRMRFSESIKFTGRTQIAITDTMGNRYAGAYPLYIPSAEPYVLFAQSLRDLAPESSYEITVTGVEDVSGNPVDSLALQFTGSSQQDTTLQRIIRRRRQSGLYPSEAVEIIYARPVEEEAVADSVVVVKGSEVLGEGRGITVERNILSLRPQGGWEEGIDYEIRFWNPSTAGFKTVRPLIWHKNQLGKLSVEVSDSSQSGAKRLHILSAERGLMVDTTFTGSVTVEGLPPISYKVKGFVDRNGNGRWDHGSVDPYEAPERYVIRTGVPVKRGFSSALTLSFKPD